jgi:hypothetical protein
MDIQIPAEGISKRKSWPDADYYQVPCECGCNNSIDFSIEIDEGSIVTTFCSTTKTNYWYNLIDVKYSENWMLLNTKLFINDWYNRLTIVWHAIVHGYFKTESCVLLTPQQALNFSEVLKEGITKYEKLNESGKKEVSNKFV